MENDKTIAIIRDIVRVIRTGGGILGKSAGVMALLVICFGIALTRVHSDNALVEVLGIGVVAVFLWFMPILWLVNKYPEKAFLEGPEWTEHHRWELAAKGFGTAPTTAETLPSPIADPPNGIIGQQNNRRLS